MIYELILGLRLKDGVSIKEFEEKYNISIYEAFKIDELINKK